MMETTSNDVCLAEIAGVCMDLVEEMSGEGGFNKAVRGTDTSKGCSPG